MRRIRPPGPRSPFVLALLLLAAACGEGGPGDTIASPQELRLTIVRGAGMRTPVRPVDTPAGEVAVSPDPVIVEVSALIGASGQARLGATGPALEVRLPPVELRWRSLNRWCEPLHAVTPLTRGDTVHNHYRLPTIADACVMVVEGVSNGWVFDSDTAFVKFDPGPAAVVGFPPRRFMVVGEEVPFSAFVGNVQDAYGNLFDDPPVSVALTAGGADFRMLDTSMVALREGAGAVRATVGSFSGDVVLWAFPDIEKGRWRLTWACHDVQRPGGVRADSIRFVMDDAAANYGGGTPQGSNASFTGRTVIREFRPGQPVIVTELSAYFSVVGILRPGEAEWSPGQVARRTATGWEGGSLCQQVLTDPAGGFAPARVEAR